MSSECQLDRTSLEQFADGELAGAARREVEAHLEACQACRARLDAMRLSADLLRRHLESVADEADFSGFDERVFAAIAAEPSPGPLVRLGRWILESFLAHRGAWVATAATAAVFLAILLPLLGGDTPIDRSPDEADARPQVAQTDPGRDVDNEVIIDSMEYAGQRTMIFTVSKNNTTVIWMTDFDRSGAQDSQGDDI